MQISLLSLSKIYGISNCPKSDVGRNMRLPKRMEAGVVDSPSKER